MKRSILLLVLLLLISTALTGEIYDSANALGMLLAFQSDVGSDLAFGRGIDFRDPLPISSSTSHKTKKKSVPDTIPSVSRLDIAFDLGTTGGENFYEIKWAYGPSIRVRSKLEYPHNNQQIGGNLEWRRMNPVKKDIYIRASVNANINNPKKPMYDSDWMTALPDYVDYLFSYTESEARMDMLDIDGAFGFELFSHTNLSFFTELGYLYQSYSFEVYDLDGWQSDGVVADTFSSYQDTLVGTYDIDFKGLYLTARAEYSPGETFTFGGNFKMSPMMTEEDRDDHILRYKESTSTIKNGLYLAAEANVRAEKDLGRIALFADLRVFTEDFDFEGEHTQHWYGDEESTPDYDETGDEADVPLTIEYYRKGVVLSLGLSF